MTPATDTPVGHTEVRMVGSTDALPIAPALGLSLDAARMPRKSTLVTRRILLISVLAVILGVASAYVAQLLMLLINLITDLCYYGRISDVIGPNAKPGSWGGHYVFVPGYTAAGPVCVTWGRKQQMTWDWLDKYCDEAYAIFDAKNTAKKSVINFAKLDALIPAMG